MSQTQIQNYSIGNDEVNIDKITFETALVPVGGIIMWSGTIAQAQALSGWALCDGTNGTPDLRNRFIIGASVDVGGITNTSITGSNTKTGGSKNSIVPSHYHNLLVNQQGGYSWNPANEQYLGIRFDNGGEDSALMPTVGAGNTPNVGRTGTSGQSVTNANLPPYYALAFIMRVS